MGITSRRVASVPETSFAVARSRHAQQVALATAGSRRRYRVKLMTRLTPEVGLGGFENTDVFEQSWLLFELLAGYDHSSDGSNCSCLRFPGFTTAPRPSCGGRRGAPRRIERCYLPASGVTGEMTTSRSPVLIRASVSQNA